MAIATTRKPFQIGFFSYLEGHELPSEIYRKAVETYIRADELGIDKAWVAHHHLGHHGGLPTPLVFFASLAGRTKHLGFGTAVLTLPTENAIHLAEDAAVFETLHPGRLDLGFGTGFGSDAALDTFGQSNKNRREVYNEAILRLRDAFNGEILNSAGDTLYPEAPQLNRRLWESPGSVPNVIAAARRGNGLLLSRVAIGTDRDTDEVQRELVDAYYSALPKGVEPRIALSRTVYPTNDPESAYQNLARGVQAGRDSAARQGRPQPERTMEEDFEHFSIHWGEPDQVIATLRQEPLLGEITDLVCQLSPGTQTLEQNLEALELLATKVGPALGWTPANAVTV